MLNERQGLRPAVILIRHSAFSIQHVLQLTLLPGAVGSEGLTTMTRPTTRELFTSMSMPRTFVHGEHGEPLVGADQLRSAGIRVLTVPNAGHMMMDDNPEGYLAALVEALAA